MQKLIKNLRLYNQWRRGANIPQPNPREIGEWISEAADRLEHQNLNKGCAVCDEIARWNEEEYLDAPLDKYYIQALEMLRNKKEKHEIADVIAKLLREKQ